MKSRAHTAGPCPPFAVLSVFRAEHEGDSLALCRAADAAGAAILLWDLDEVCPPGLAPWIVGSGPGERHELLNRMERKLPGGFGGWLVLTDDDVSTGRLDLATLVRVTRAASIDIGQPAHTARSHFSWPATLRRPLSIARRTALVEIGPVVVVSPRARAHVFPIESSTPMGLGAEFEWPELTERHGFVLGMVDAVPIRHLVPPGARYRSDIDLTSLRSRIDELGGFRRMARTLEVWYPTRATPPWADG